MKITLAIITTVLVPIALCSCRTSPTDRRDLSRQQNEVLLVALAHMVTNADTNLDSPRFVDTTPQNIEALRRYCGPSFQIFSINESEVLGNTLVLKGTSKEGVHLDARVSAVGKREAEASGAYKRVHSVVIFRYKLVRSRGVWQITSTEFELAS